MKLLVFSLFLIILSSAADYEWTWLGGSDVINKSGKYGEKLKPSTNNSPGSRNKQDGFALNTNKVLVYAGYGIDYDYISLNSGYLNDVWVYDVSNYQWEWKAGGTIINADGVYGTIGIESDLNVPGGRYPSIAKVNDNTAIIFGGRGYGGYLNDIWTLNTDNYYFTWHGGSNLFNARATYGTRGIESADNQIGSRDGHSLTISGSKAYVFGGWGFDSSGSTIGYLNDLWAINLDNYQMTWVHGSDISSCYGTYVDFGSESQTAQPGGRNGRQILNTMSDGKILLYGGYGFSATSNGQLNDIWIFNPVTNLWKWEGGDGSLNRYATYGSIRTFGSFVPGYRTSNSIYYRENQLINFGGHGYGKKWNNGFLNDLLTFYFDKGWVWLSGTLMANIHGTYGNITEESNVVMPGARMYSLILEVNNDTYVFFGSGYDKWSESNGYLNDIFKISIPQSASSPTIHSPSNPSINTLDLSWSPGEAKGCEFSNWIVKITTGPSSGTSPEGCTEFENREVTSCTASDLTSNTEYQFTVSEDCTDILTNSQSSSPSSSFSTLKQPADTPNITSIQVDSDTKIFIQWEYSNSNDCEFSTWQIKGYLGVSEFTPDGCSEFDNREDTSCIATNLTSQTEYQFTVREICVDNETNSEESSKSSTSTLPTEATPPTITSVSNPGVFFVDITWTPGIANDCEFSNWIVKIVNGPPEEIGFTPEGCISFDNRNMVTCTPYSLTSNTEYQFSVTETCENHLADSNPSLFSTQISTLPLNAFVPIMNDPIALEYEKLNVSWTPSESNDCIFDQWWVIIWEGPDKGTIPEGCNGMYIRSTTYCIAKNLDADFTYSFSVQENCTNIQSNSGFSDPSEGVQPIPSSSVNILLNYFIIALLMVSILFFS